MRSRIRFRRRERPRRCPGGVATDASEATPEHEEGVAHRLAHQWAAVRRQEREHEHERSAIAAGPSNFRRGEVPWGLDLAAAWSWRLLVIAAAAGWSVSWSLASSR